ncbi:GDP-mannose 4,6 dehydratase [Paenibacillus sambharensis]|uniref:GDP-mannose 4,6 dehydratase n=1 Tax=Paenibacillus sambharensis TaxID=1803190 RepID=A0A2W1LE71_9BACL|nr:GDP-mannose 4,6-dehydratase [Paenibacillus sambharensis]PZD96380.1 GDP-mannose 4,6 dehydratase [Paenibacillus sambharensis]
MKRALITGVTGFAGRYLAKNLLDHGYEVWGGARNGSINSVNGVKLIELNYTSYQEIQNKMNDLEPDVVFHLSGQSSVRRSWDIVEETFDANLMASINLLDGIRHSNIKEHVTLLTIGSSEEYGPSAKSPITEDSVAAPANPYGLSKYALGNLSMMYNKVYNMKTIHVRSFNHIGPGQSEGFVTSDFAKQVTDIAKGLLEPIMYVGDLSSRRDFTDVRDIVEAYRLLYERGEAGQIYNVCSSNNVAVKDILDTLVSFAEVQIDMKTDPAKLRPNNVLEYYGSNGKITEVTGWKPQIPLEQSLHDIYKDWLKGS